MLVRTGPSGGNRVLVSRGPARWAGDRVLVKAEALAEKTAGGLLLPTSAVQTESVLFGEVLDVGDECSEAGVAKGSHIVFTEYAATQVDAADGEVCFVRGDDILAVLS